MLTQNIYYQEEKSYNSSRLIMLLAITFLSIVLQQQVDGVMGTKILYVLFTLIGLTVISLFLYLFIMQLPNTLTVTRKNILIFSDLAVLTYFMILFDRQGIFLLPIYTILVMRNGLSFGIRYFYMSIVLATISWIILIIYSNYWADNLDILTSFSIMTLVIPMFYLNVITRVHEKNDELSRELVDTEHDAKYDTLTGIANRKMYKEYMRDTMRQREPFSLLFIDLNKFKVINDTYGHDVGDKVLQEAVSRLSHSIDNDDFIARLGGDEFVIITKRKRAFVKKFVEKIGLNSIGKHEVNGITVLISLSIGISSYPDDAADEMMMSKYADEAMYSAKKTDGTFYQFYSDIKKEVPKSKILL